MNRKHNPSRPARQRWLQACCCAVMIAAHGGAAANPATAALGAPEAITSNATSALPPLAASSDLPPAARSLLEELKQFAPRAWLLSEQPDKALAAFEFSSVEGEAEAGVATVGGMPFRKVYKIQTVRKPQEWMTFIQAYSDVPVKRGDVLYATAWVRATKLPDGKPQGMGRLYASLGKGQYLHAKNFDIPTTWTRVHFPMVADRDASDTNRLHFMFTFGHTPQTIEIGGIQAVNLGPGVDKGRLPHAQLNLDYPGRAADAAWRKAALARIEQHRKAPLTIVVKDKSGAPVPDAEVSVAMTRHDFLFCSSFPYAMLPPEYQKIVPKNDDFMRTAGASPQDKARIQAEFLRLFNCTTGPLVWSTWGGLDTRISKDDIRGGLRWFAERNIPVYNTQAVYPSIEFTPLPERKLIEAGKAAEFSKALKEFVTMSATQFTPPIRSLQIANEIEGRPHYHRLLGIDAVPEWFKWVKEANPAMLVEANGPYRLGETPIKTEKRGDKWPDTEGLQFHYDFISWLLKRGAPIDFVGVQNHVAIGAAGPEAVLASLDQLATLGKPLEITEYEMSIQNGRDAAQRQYQADYTRDFYIAVFSHPQTRMIMLQDFWQPAAWQYQAASSFFNKDWSINPHGKVYEDLVLGKWWTRERGKTDSRGAYALRGFLGEYELVVRHKDRVSTHKLQLMKSTGTVDIRLSE